MSLKNDILAAWARCKNEHERGEILGQIEAARHEIRIEYLWGESELRLAIADLEGSLTSIMRGKYSIAPLKVTEADTGRTAPLVGAAGHIAMLLAIRADRMQRQLQELKGEGVHECRIHDALEARKHPAKPMDGGTGYVYPVDPLTIDCMICKAPKGTKCTMVPTG
jgi:hypothetical protein